MSANTVGTFKLNQNAIIPLYSCRLLRRPRRNLWLATSSAHLPWHFRRMRVSIHGRRNYPRLNL